MADQNNTALARMEECVAPVPLADLQPHISNARFEELKPILQLIKWFYAGMGLCNLSKGQAKTLPHIVTQPHKNLIFCAPTGNGKSIGLVMAVGLRVDLDLKFPQAICIVPNRYLANQMMDLLSKMKNYSGITSELADMATENSQVIIGTADTILKLIVAKKLYINGIKMFLIDNVDHVLAEGFKDNVLRIMKAISRRHPACPQCQVIMCSTKSSDVVEAFVSETQQVVNENEYISMSVSLDDVKMYKVNVADESSKVKVLKKLLDVMAEIEIGQAIIFVQKIELELALFERLGCNRIKFHTITIDYTDEFTTHVLNEFKERRLQVLISTKTLGRGLDLSEVRLVVFFDLSILLGSSSEPNLEQYWDCIGRGAMFDRKGAVYNLMCGDMDTKIMEKIETVIKVNPVNSDVQFKDSLESWSREQRCAV